MTKFVGYRVTGLQSLRVSGLQNLRNLSFEVLGLQGYGVTVSELRVQSYREEGFLMEDIVKKMSLKFI